jgi:hypothetical protein
MDERNRGERVACPRRRVLDADGRQSSKRENAWCFLCECRSPWSEKVGYTRRDRFKRAKVHTAIGEEHGYWLRMAELTVLGVTTPNFALTVFPLGDKDVDGLVGMNFLRHFNFEVRPADRQILVELVKR